MRMLLWKDYRLNRLLLAIGLGLLLGPHLGAAFWLVYEQWPAWPAARSWAALLFGASYFSLSLSQLTLALLGGNAFAGERADRSAEFLAYLPPSRGQVLASKALLALLVLLVIWAFNLAAAEVLAPLLSREPFELFEPPPKWQLLGGVLLFGAAWLGSTFLDSPTFAATLGIAAPLLLLSALSLSAALFGLPPRDGLVDWYVAACLLLGPVCFLAGTWYYLRRVEP